MRAPTIDLAGRLITATGQVLPLWYETTLEAHQRRAS